MLYIGTRKQRELLNDYIDDINCSLYEGMNQNRSKEYIESLRAQRDSLMEIKKRGYGIIPKLL